MAQMLSKATANRDSGVVSRFAHIYKMCPMCDSPEVEYEFVVDRVAVSQCAACTVLFANPHEAGDNAQLPMPETQAAYEVLKRFASAYLKRPVQSVLLIDAGWIPTDDVADVRHAVSRDTSKKYDLVVAIGVVERDPNAIELLESLRGVISVGGVLLVVTPSLTSTSARAMRETWPQLGSKAAWWFSPDTAQLLLTRALYGDFVIATRADDLGADSDPAIRSFFASNLAIFCRPVERSDRKLLSVIVPVYNEAATVGELLDAVTRKTLDGIDIEIIIVESNSTDGSRDIVKRYADLAHVRLIFEERPSGKGSAVRVGLQHARGDVVLFQDADLEYDVSDYDRLIEPLFSLKRNFILGSRHGARGDGWKIRRFEKRRIFSSAMNLAHLALLRLFNKLFQQTLFDPFTMFKVFRRDCLYGLTFKCKRFDFDIEIAGKLIRKGYTPLEIPVNYRSRSFSDGKKVAIFGDPPTWIKAMFRVAGGHIYGGDTDLDVSRRG